VISIERCPGRQADVNSYLLSDIENVIVVELLRNSAEAEELADHVEATGKRLMEVFISHGHPDHYIGAGVIHRRFPDTPIKVASSEIRDDIVRFSVWMETVGWLDTGPHMKPRSDRNPLGFDYASLISALTEPFLSLPLEASRIHVQYDYAPCECGHMSTMFIPEQRVFFAFDFLYNRVHAWCGPGVDKRAIQNWMESLDGIRQRTPTGGWTFYCGHGAEGDERLITAMKHYLQTFVAVTSASETPNAALTKMKELVQEFAQDDFLLPHSVNFHVNETPLTAVT